MAKPLKKSLPTRSGRKYQFVLTPLADAMFQLLIFFMLSSNLAPYSLLTLRSGVDAQDAGGGSDPADVPPPPADAAIWTVEADQIIVGGQRFARENLPALAEALNDEGNASVVLILRDAALVQDLSSVLEALTASGINSVQIAAGGDA